MQCPSCGFQNLPGLDDCARCGSVLSVNDVDVTPYRRNDRGAWWRRVRHRLPHRAAPAAPRWRLMLDVLAARPPRPAGTPFRGERLRWVLASIIPGLGHYLSGRRRAGRIIFASYAAALLGSVLLMAWAWGLLLAVALGLHTYAVLDCAFYRTVYVHLAVRMLTGLLVFAALVLGPYRAAAWALGGLFRLEAVAQVPHATCLHQGDVVVVHGAWLRPAVYSRGDLVSYRVPHAQGQGWYVQEGVSFDRILAGPGDRVVCREGKFIVNGQAIPEYQGPLVERSLPEQLDQVVPEGSYFIYPSLLDLRVHGRPNIRDGEARMRLSVSIVPAAAISGRALMVVSPLTRLGLL